VAELEERMEEEMDRIKDKVIVRLPGRVSG
jgi:hypothetical protein